VHYRTTLPFSAQEKCSTKAEDEYHYDRPIEATTGNKVPKVLDISDCLDTGHTH